MGEHGSPYTRFRRAVATRSPMLVTAAALELGRLSLADALAVCLVFCDHDAARFERAAVRWLGRFCCECSSSISRARVRVDDDHPRLLRDVLAARGLGVTASGPARAVV